MWPPPSRNTPLLRNGAYFLAPLNPGAFWPLWPNIHGKSIAVSIPGIALNWLCSFSFMSLESQPLCKNVNTLRPLWYKNHATRTERKDLRGTKVPGLSDYNVWTTLSKNYLLKLIWITEKWTMITVLFLVYVLPKRAQQFVLLSF